VALHTLVAVGYADSYGTESGGSESSAAATQWYTSNDRTNGKDFSVSAELSDVGESIEK
jgi:hypothetical protein